MARIDMNVLTYVSDWERNRFFYWLAKVKYCKTVSFTETLFTVLGASSCWKLICNLHAAFCSTSNCILNICRRMKENGLLKDWGMLLLVLSLGPRFNSLLCLKQFTRMFPTSQKSALTIKVLNLFRLDLSNSPFKSNPTLTEESCFLINAQGLYHLH